MIPTFVAALGGFAGAAVLAVPAILVLRARTTEWRRRLGEVSRRLAELEARESQAAPDLETALAALEIPDPDPATGEALEEALGELEAALRDEERLRELRRESEDGVREAMRTGRALADATPDDHPALERLSGLLERLAEATDLARESADDVLQRTAAGEEVAALLEKHARVGREGTADAARATEGLGDQIDRIGGLLRRLTSRTREIGQVLVVLNDITEQTNLLALNAAIIAAQAGSEGQGFGVVAEEMRNLSERASSSTKETELLAQTLRDDVSQASRALVEAGEMVRALRLSLSDARESTGVLADLGEKNVERTRAAARAAERGAAGLRELGHAAARAAEERETLVRLETDVLRPTRRALQEVARHLEAQWQVGAVRESLRTRLESAVVAVRDRRGRDRIDRRALEERVLGLRETSRAWARALEDGKRRDHLVSAVARDIRELAPSGPEI